MHKIIDIHTHYFPRENLEALLIDFKEQYWLNLIFPKGRKSLQGLPSQAEFIKAMDNANITKAIVQGAYWQSQEACDYFNKSTLDFAKNYPDRILPLGIICPKFLKESLAFIEEARDLGFVGIGELCDKVQGFEVDTLCQIVEACQRQDLPISFHLSDEIGKDYNGKVHTNNDALFELAKAYPKQKFIFSHLGGGRALRENIFAENIYFDTAALPLLYKEELWAKLDFKQTKKLCFATDYSLILYPKSQKEANFSGLKDEALRNIPKEYQPDFFYKNANTLFNLQS